MPTPLTLEALSQHYEVSLTPVRTALSALAAAGLLKKKANGRLEPVHPKRPRKKPRFSSAAPGSKVTESNDLVRTITEDFVKLSLKGEAIHLREEATAAQYGLSRSAFRNILHQLSGQGLLEHVPRRGWKIRPFRKEDLQAFIEVREVLELKALEVARPRLTNADAEADLRAMLDGNLEPASVRDPVAIDNSLHHFLIQKAGNPYITDFFARHGHYYNILFYWEALDRPAALAAAQQHRDILSAILEANWRLARKALSHHIRENHPVLSQIQP